VYISIKYKVQCCTQKIKELNCKIAIKIKIKNENIKSIDLLSNIINYIKFMSSNIHWVILSSF